MKRSELKQIIKEEISKQIDLSEGLLDKAASALINKMIKSKYGKYFDELHADPEYQEALKGLALAAERIEDSATRYRKSADRAKNAYDALVKKVGKKAADVYNEKSIKKYTTKSGW